jgi:hypothetical protein
VAAFALLFGVVETAAPAPSVGAATSVRAGAGLELPALSAPAPRPHHSWAQLTGLAQHQTEATALTEGLTFAGLAPGGIGASWQLRPLPVAGDDLVLEATYLGGSHAMPLMGEDVEVRRRLWGVAAQTSWLGDRLHLHAEYAEGDEWVVGSDQTSVSADDAYRLSARYQGPSISLASRPLEWDLRLRSQSVERDFWSLAANGLERGKAIDEAGLDFQWGSLDARLQQQRRIDLTDTVAGETTELTALQVSYRPPPDGWLSVPFALFANPVYGGSFSRESVELRGDMAQARDIESVSARLRFQPARWWWELNHGYSALDHEHDASVDEWRNRTAVIMNIPLTSRWRIQPVIEWATVELADQRSGSRQRCTLESAISLVPGRLDTRLSFEARREEDPFSDDTTEWLRSQAEIRWVVMQQGSDQPSVTLSLRGIYQHSDTTDLAQDQYQAYASIEMLWPDN